MNPVNIGIGESTLEDFYKSSYSKERINSPQVDALVSLMKANRHYTVESLFLDFMRHFNGVALLPKGRKGVACNELVSYHQLQAVFQDLLLARKRLEQEEFDDWLNSPAYEKDGDNEHT